MPDFSAERALLTFLLLNAAVFGSAFFFSRRRLNTHGSQTGLDALLLEFVIQYLAVGIPGLIGCLNLATLSIAALILGSVLLIVSLPPKPALRYAEGPGRATRTALWGVGAFVLSFILSYIHTQAYLPVLSNDALTYHFPAAVQWLQHGRIDLFQTWFFNPANTYSPLAGSMFIVWLMAPFHSVVVARFVEVPPLLGIGLAMYRIARQLSQKKEPRTERTREVSGDGMLHRIRLLREYASCAALSSLNLLRIRAALLAATAMLARPIFLPSMMGKDDLFVAFFFLVAVESLGRRLPRDTGLRPVLTASKEQGVLTDDETSTGRRPVSREMVDALRAGVAIGLMLATKYTAFFCIPVLLLAIGNRWTVRQWTACVLCIVTFAGPWYLRNWIATGNPVFPLAIDHLLPGLFTTARSDALLGWNAGRMVIGTQYGLPFAMAVVLGMGWGLNWIFGAKRVLIDPLRRMCVIGPVIGIGLFCWRSPFPEIRFLLPFFLLLMVSLSSIIPAGIVGTIIAVLLPIGALMTLGDWHAEVMLRFVMFSLIASAVLVLLVWWVDARMWRCAVVSSIIGLSLTLYAYINWGAYSRDFADASAYSMEYPPGLCDLWQFVNQHVPADATVAYTNLYLIFPMQQSAPARRFVYAPTRPGVKTIADLGWLGEKLSGEKIVKNAAAATMFGSDREVWMKNLRSTGAQFIVMGHSESVSPEAQFVRTGGEFEKLFSEEGREVWRINPKSETRNQKE